jgi:gluconate 2-dehydrogenase gamma chain
MAGKDDPTHDGKAVSRRDVLVGAGAVVGTGLVGPYLFALGQDSVPVTLSREEHRTLDAVCRRLIPSDENGPGAGEAMAVRYIDRALGGALAGSRDQYAEGLAGLDRYARATRGAAFAEMDPAAQDAVLEAVQDGEAEGVGADFFNTVRTHTIQGMFSDPFYGGNAGFVGWDIIGYPGVRVSVPSEYQQMDVEHPPNHVSVYDSTMFEPGQD